MVKSPYTFLRKKHYQEFDVVVFNFISTGRRQIFKEISFRPFERNGQKYFNWGLCDIIQDKVSREFHSVDSASSNNGDAMKILHTAASTLALFFATHPHATVFLKGRDIKRTRVFVSLILRHWNDLENRYSIKMLVGNDVLPFINSTNHEAILIFKKQQSNIVLKSTAMRRPIRYTNKKRKRKEPGLSPALLKWYDARLRDYATGKVLPNEEKFQEGAEILRRAGLIK